MSEIAIRGKANKQIANFRDYNEPKKRDKPKRPKFKRKNPAKGFKNDLL